MDDNMNWFALAQPLTARQVRAVMFGHAIADAMGVPVEFRDRDSLRADPVTDYRAYGSHQVPAGTWSDDTSMALASLDSLSRGLNYHDLLTRFCSWKLHADYTATGVVFDMGITTQQALHKFQCGTPALQSGLVGEFENGNGSLMRIIPAVLYCCCHPSGTRADVEIIHNISALTHGHLRSRMGCGIYAFVLAALLNKPEKASVSAALAAAEAFYRGSEWEKELKTYARVFQPDFASLPEEQISSSGYVVATLEAALWCLLTTDSYAECILKAVNLGKDTDTVAAVAGGLAGALYSMDGIPVRWYEGLIKKEEIEALCQQFCSANL